MHFCQSDTNVKQLNDFSSRFYLILSNLIPKIFHSNKYLRTNVVKWCFELSVLVAFFFCLPFNILFYFRTGAKTGQKGLKMKLQKTRLRQKYKLVGKR